LEAGFIGGGRAFLIAKAGVALMGKSKKLPVFFY
jgi:hypothetical protein